ncbi:hypothetical protein CHS0354_042324 [Potamilus streckersoni]|uniref:Uncharacterized protein n=1 Tax=Potamilus streckersoni TaxID=2493646 RepID=A0AAE0W1S1_9BIVA|nr:hypothetical protein CHS0354_042324 [Potamilus streckersoni]
MKVTILIFTVLAVQIVCIYCNLAEQQGLPFPSGNPVPDSVPRDDKRNPPFPQEQERQQQQRPMDDKRPEHHEKQNGPSHRQGKSGQSLGENGKIRPQKSGHENLYHRPPLPQRGNELTPPSTPQEENGQTLPIFTESE